MLSMKKIFLTVSAALLCCAASFAQEQDTTAPQDTTRKHIRVTTQVWTLQDCIDYAMENNISLQQGRNDYLSGIEDTEQARQAIFPTVSGSVSGSAANYPLGESAINTAGLSYGVNANMVLFQGGTLRNNIKKQEYQNSIDSLSVKQNEMDIKVSIIEAYMRCLYAEEAISVNEKIAEASKVSRDRAYEMWKAGSISKVDYTQLESQYYSDRYQVTVARVTYDTYKMQLKQILELGITTDLQLVATDATDEEVLTRIPDKMEVYEKALEVFPEVKSGDLAVYVAELNEKNAKAGYLPTVSASAGVGAYNNFTNSGSSSNQFRDSFNENLGLTVSVPIFSARKNKTAVNKAHLAYINSQLDQLATERNILSEVESTWLDTVSAQSQFESARQQQEYAQESYDLTKEQFRLGMKNTVELITAENNLLSAAQSALQAKYTALLNKEVLDVYQGLL